LTSAAYQHRRRESGADSMIGMQAHETLAQLAGLGYVGQAPGREPARWRLAAGGRAGAGHP